MKKILWSCVVVGIINIVLAILNAVGVFSSLKAINDFVRFILPYQSLVVSFYSIPKMLPYSRTFIENLLSPFIGYAFSIILIISGIGTIWIKPWGRTFAYIYATSIILISAIGFPIILKGFIREFTHIEKYGFLEGLVWAWALGYILVLIGTLLYPIILLIFFSRPKVKELFNAKK